MKILKLTLCNLAAFSGEHTLDFTASPLSECGLFAITGPTGAGKSTLLDALCLALFDNTPRLRQIPSMSGTMPGEEHVQLSNPRTLMRRGCSHASAEVTFIGVDGLRYTASWSVRRARNKPNGRLQNTSQSLRCLDPEDRLITDGKADFAKRLPEILGLNFDQFTRAVLLAQAEFSAFLKASDNERSALLEKLTDSDIYSRISQQAYRQYNDIRQRNAALIEQMTQECPCDDDARLAIIERSQQAADALTECTNALEKHRHAEHVLEQQLHAIEAYRATLRQLRQCEATWQDSAERRDLHAALVRFSSIREAVARHTTLLPHCEQLTVSLHEYEYALCEAQSAFTKSQHLLKTTRAQREQLVQQQSEEAASFDAARTAEQRLQQLAEQVRTQKKTLDDVAQRCLEGHAALTRLEKAYEEDLLARDNAAAALSRLARSPDARLQTLRGRLGALDLQSRRWESRKEQAEHYDTLLHRHECCQQQHDKAQKKWNALQTAHSEAEATAQQAAAEYALLRDTLHAFEARTLEVLRSTLTEGTPCIVCGSLSHTTANVPQSMIEAQREARERQLAPLKQTCQNTLAHAKQLNDALQSAYAALTAARTRLDDAAKAVDQMKTTRPSTWCNARCTTLKARQQYWQSTARTLENSLYQHRQLDERLQQVDLEHREYLGALTRDEAQHASLQKSHHEIECLLAAEQSRLYTLLGPHSSCRAWQAVRCEAFDGATRQEQLAEAQLDDARRTLDAATTAQHVCHDKWVQSHSHCDALHEQIATWKNSQPTPWNTAASLEKLRNISSEIQSSLGERLEREAHALNDARAEHTACLRQCHSILSDEQAEALISDTTALAEGIKKDLQAHGTSLKAFKAAIEAARQDYDAARMAVAVDDQRRKRYATLDGELQAAKQTLERWGRISGLIGSADGARFRRMAQQWHLDQLIHHANHHLQTLARRFRLKRGGTELGLMIIDDDMGNEERSVHSLSGGETFLVSLALALGLAVMASDRLVIGTLFIDEGFGSLDAQARAMAMDALEALQAQGRQVGIISHVQELHERIPVQIEVHTGGRNGASELALRHSHALIPM